MEKGLALTLCCFGCVFLLGCVWWMCVSLCCFAVARNTHRRCRRDYRDLDFFDGRNHGGRMDVPRW